MKTLKARRLFGGKKTAVKPGKGGGGKGGKG